MEVLLRDARATESVIQAFGHSTRLAEAETLTVLHVVTNLLS